MGTSGEVRAPRRWGPSALGASTVAALLTLACQEATGPQWVDSLSLQPDSLYLVPGESRDFGVVPLDQHDNPLPDRAGRVEWALSNRDVAGLETTETGATITGVAPGTTFVRVELGRGSGTGAVHVEPAELSEIRIEPSPIEVGYRAERVIVRAVLIDLDGNEVAAEGYRVSWGISNTDIFIMVGRQEVITAVSSSISGRTRGSAALKLAVGDRTVSTQVIVR